MANIIFFPNAILIFLLVFCSKQVDPAVVPKALVLVKHVQNNHMQIYSKVSHVVSHGAYSQVCLSRTLALELATTLFVFI